MNYILQKLNCKALIIFILAAFTTIACLSCAYAYTVRRFPSFIVDGNACCVAEGVSPRATSYSSVTVSYDDLANMVFYFNSHGIDTTLTYNSAIKKVVGYVHGEGFSIPDLEITSLSGLLCSPTGQIYVAEDSGKDIIDLIDNGKIWNNYGIGQWGIYADYSSSSVLREVSYATLSELCASLNEKGIPCYISSTSAWGSSTYWYIRGSGTITYRPRYDAPSTSYSITDHVYLDIASAPLVARYNPESTLSSCLSRLTSIQTNVTTIKNNLVNTIGSNLESLLTTCNTISTKLDTLTSVISNGKVLVDNSDVVSAVQSIPAFDDTDIITAIQSIPAYDDSALVSAVTTISNQITEQFGEYESTYSFPSFYSQSTSSNKTISGVSSSAFSSINPGSRKLLYSPSSALTLSKDLVYSGGGICQAVYCSPYISQTYGLGYQLNFTFRFSYTQNTSRSETVQFPKFSFTDFSGKTLTKNPYTGSVRVPPRSNYAYASSYYFPRWDASGNWLGWSGQNDTFQWISSTYEPSKRVYLTPPEYGTYYIYGTSDTAIPVVYASRFTGFLQSQTDRVVNAVGSIPAPTDYTPQLTAVVEKLDALANKSAVDLTTIESTLSTISDKLDNTASDVNNTIINITNDNDYFSVFYITDGDGNTRSVTDFAGALTGASGKLLSLLYRLVFADALGSVDGDLGNMEDFFTSEEPPPATAAMDGDTAPANEVIDVWAS